MAGKIEKPRFNMGISQGASLFRKRDLIFLEYALNTIFRNDSSLDFCVVLV